MAQIQKIGNVFYRVPRGRLDEVVQFYEQVLGLRLKFRDGDKWVAFDVGGLTLALSGVDGEMSAGGGATVSPRVDDLDAFRRTLEERGAKVGDIVAGEHERTLEVNDPLGNTLVLYEPRASA